MVFVNKIKNFILNNSIKNNLLGLYSTIIVFMSVLLLTMLFYSVDLNRSYNKVMLNFQKYNKIYYQVDAIDSDIYLNITEQKDFDEGYYEKIINDMKNEFIEIGDNLDENKSITSIASIEILTRTVDSLGQNIHTAGILINDNASYASREKILNEITHIKEIIKGSIQELMEINLTQSQQHINIVKNGYNIALTFIIILFLIAVFTSISFLLFVIKDTVNKIHIVSENANRLANGDLSIEHINFGNSNEFQILALSFNKMKNNINSYIKQLSTSEMRMSSILNALNDCIVTTNSSGEIESCNTAVEKIFGYKKDEVIGHNISGFISEIDFSSYKEHLFRSQKLIKNVKVIDNKYQLDCLKKDNTIIPVEVSYNEVEFEDKRAITFVIHDITEHKNVEKMKNEFVSTVSHELRTPLTSIKGSLGLIISGVLGALPEKIESLLNIANSNCTRLTNLINDILDLEKIKAGKYTFMYEELEVNSLLEHSITLNQSYADQFGMQIKFINSANEAYIKADKSRILQVISNLISNAVKFSKLGGEVLVISEIINNNIKVSVVDQGIGIPDDSKYKIFQSFSQVDSSDTRSKGGTGLGLSISKIIIENMGGNIGFDSQIGKGSTFFFIMPSIEKGSFVKIDNETIKELNTEDF